MAQTYTYSISADVPAGQVDINRLWQDISSSAIVTALDNIKVVGDTLSVIFKAALSAGDKTLLDNDTTAPSGGLIGAHTGAPLEDRLPVQLNAEQSGNSIRVVLAGTADGSDTNFSTHNFCDRTTWFTDSARRTGQSLSQTSGTEFQAPDTMIICMDRGRVHRENYLVLRDVYEGAGHGWKVTLYADGSPLTKVSEHQDAIAANGDYYVNYETGAFHTFADYTGVAMTADYSYAQGSGWALEAKDGYILEIQAAETQFSQPFTMTDAIVFRVQAWSTTILADLVAAALVPADTWVSIDQLPLPVQEMLPGTPADYVPLVYQTKRQLYQEGRGSYPVIYNDTQANADAQGRLFRGFVGDVQGFPFKYDATRLIGVGYRLHVQLENHVPFEGKEATGTFYCRARELS